ncbi:MAG: polyprenyl synthetase family protein [Puniceicoccales bacterium]|jgi:geranylgeranyl pyrophosphate synthase|nr:polyprenyl synthetase family protein [Puniceicoccales bacterium]
MQPDSPEFSRQLKGFTADVESALERLTPSPQTRPAVIHEAMRHSLKAGGKRLRPLLCLAAHSLFPSRLDPLPAAVALECLHTYSLIHDDLPCMDNSDLRRGQPTCHKKFGEPVALLAGDALLTHALWLLADAYRDVPAVANALVCDLGDAASSCRLIGGQVEDILGERGEITADRLDFIHHNKTAALISASIAMGVRLADSAPQGAVESARKAGLAAGLAFQIIDDILDLTSDVATMGKPVHADEGNKKLTYPRLHGLEASRAKARELTDEAAAGIESLGGAGSFLLALIRRMEHRIS